LYFFRQNLLGIHESSDKALKIMIATTIMAVIMLTWCGLTLAVKGPSNPVPSTPNLDPKVELEVVKVDDPVTGTKKERWVKDPETGQLVPEIDPDTGAPKPKESEALGKVGITAQEDPLGLLGRLLPENVVRQLRRPGSWLSLVGIIGLFIAF